MTRDAEGLWSATVGPLSPDVYVYYFTVDGVRLPDPANPQVKIGYVTSTTTSIVNVPGDGPAFYDVQDVPHGEIRTILYKSRSNNAVRELNVYLPPGYDAASRQRYPVLYLLHGGGDDDSGWSSIGRAGFILDNLVAAKQAVPMVIVMPNGSLPRPADLAPLRRRRSPTGRMTSFQGDTYAAGFRGGARSSLRRRW